MEVRKPLISEQGQFEGPQTPAEREVMEALGLGWLSPRELHRAYLAKAQALSEAEVTIEHLEDEINTRAEKSS